MNEFVCCHVQFNILKTFLVENPLVMQNLEQAFRSASCPLLPTPPSHQHPFTSAPHSKRQHARSCAILRCAEKRWSTFQQEPPNSLQAGHNAGLPVQELCSAPQLAQQGGIRHKQQQGRSRFHVGASQQLLATGPRLYRIQSCITTNCMAVELQQTACMLTEPCLSCQPPLSRAGMRYGRDNSSSGCTLPQVGTSAACVTADA